MRTTEKTADVFKSERGIYMKKAIALVMVVVMFALAGCTEAQRVSANVSQEADNFNITRRFVAINARTDKPIMEIIGRMSIQQPGDGDVDIIVEVDNGVYKKNWVHLNDWVVYSVEDISGAYVDKYHYEVNILPEMIVPITFTSSD
jgi:maltose-binding protein MalE